MSYQICWERLRLRHPDPAVCPLQNVEGNTQAASATTVTGGTKLNGNRMAIQLHHENTSPYFGG